ncbi:uracil phosphoribosyltransferase-domain-containing protein, partial [Apodospora peruviana]
MFWSEVNDVGEAVYTAGDLETYTHIIYMDVPVDIVVKYRRGDANRARPHESESHLRRWQDAEKVQLRALCYTHHILFASVPNHDMVSPLLLHFRQDTPEQNLSLAILRLNNILETAPKTRKGRPLETVLVLDADKTLAAEDTGALFWRVAKGLPLSGDIDNSDHKCPLKSVFSSQLGYTYTAFRQVALLYEELVATKSEEAFDGYCDRVASAVKLHSEFTSLLRAIASHDHILAVVVTCGLGRIWTKILAKEGLGGRVEVMGSGRVSGDFIVTPEVKGALVAHLQEAHGLYVCAFGDSVLDLPMLCKADQAVVAVGEEHSRSKQMDAALQRAIDEDGLCASQVLLPSTANIVPRLGQTNLPVLRLDDRYFLDRLLRRRTRSLNHQVLHATDRSASRLLMTATRDARNSGPTLRHAHRLIGYYLATEFLSGVIGLEQYEIPHVQGHQTDGYRLREEKKTTIIPLMRGGEPMAFGVSDAFPLAMFVHAKEPNCLKKHHLEGQETLILVDSVVNSGKSVAEFVQHIRYQLNSPDVNIVVIAGVVQAACIGEVGLLGRMFEADEKLSLVALRLSENKFTGRGGTDTGNRLFNTTQL